MASKGPAKDILRTVGAGIGETARSACIAQANAAASALPTPAVITATCDVAKNRADPFGDGDQSFIRLADARRMMTVPSAQSLINLWCKAGDFMEAFEASYHHRGSTTRPCMSNFMLSCVLGDVEAVRAAMDGARARGVDAMFELLERRELNLRIPPLHAVIIGANFWASTVKEQQRQPPWHRRPEHVQVARLLLDAGARADAKDIAGYTLFHRCTCGQKQAWDTLLEIGHMLIGSRADPNAYNRFGSAPLEEVSMHGSVEPALLLLEAGANPRQSNYWGDDFEVEVTPEAAARLYPDVQDAFRHALTRKSVTGSQRLQGRSVILHGLSKKELNGRHGVCGRLFAIKQRYAVTVRDADGNEQELLVQIKNLRAVRGFQDQRVVLVDLSSKEMNGKEGVCGAFDEKRGRYPVTLDGTSTSESEPRRMIKNRVYQGGVGMLLAAAIATMDWHIVCGTVIALSAAGAGFNFLVLNGRAMDNSQPLGIKPQNLELVGTKVSCSHCGAAAPRMDKCNKCFDAHFCNSACVEAGWAGHKEACRASRANQATVDPSTCGPDGASFDAPSGRHRTTIVKVSAHSCVCARPWLRCGPSAAGRFLMSYCQNARWTKSFKLHKTLMQVVDVVGHLCAGASATAAHVA
jgi:hypothetical protein